MPLWERSPNIQETEHNMRKRSHDDFAGDAVSLDRDSSTIKPKTPQGSLHLGTGTVLPPHNETPDDASLQSSPTLTEAGSSTPARCSPDPQTPSKSPRHALKEKLVDTTSSTLNPPAKRKRLTGSEKEAKQKEAEERKKEKEAKAAEKAAERAKKEEAKAALAKERDGKRKEKEEEKRIKAQERDDKRRKKEEELQRIEEEKAKKERAQMTLGNFFNIPKVAKKVTEDDDKPGVERVSVSPSKAQLTPYERLFQPFFVKDNTTWTNSFDLMDEETRDVKSRTLDEAIQGQRSFDDATPFDAVSLFHLPCKPRARGRLHHPVKNIMETMFKASESQDIQSTEQANEVVREARRKLSAVPCKIIAFSRDVRPPYYGTATSKPFSFGKARMRRLGRKGTLRCLPLDYDYDSEAEWQDEEEGEDLDAEDDEEDLDSEDDMDGFLDDSEDVTVQRRLFASNLDVESTGLHFEDANRLVTNPVIHSHKLEFIQEGLSHSGIDPFSAKYWVSEAKKPTKSLPSAAATRSMPPPQPPANAFVALAGSQSQQSSLEAKTVKPDILNDLKQIIVDNKEMSKAGMVELVYSRLKSRATRPEVKNTVELVAERVGTGRQKVWELRSGHEIST